MMKKLSVFIVILFFMAFSLATAAAAEITKESKIASQFECLYKYTVLKQAEDNGAENDVIVGLKENYGRELSAYNAVSKAYSRSTPGNGDTSTISLENNGRRQSSSEVILHVGPKHETGQKFKKICMAFVLNLVLGYYGQAEDMAATLENIKHADPKDDQRNTIIEYLGDRSVGVMVKNNAALDDVRESIDSKNPVICYVGIKNISHWVLVVGYSKDTDESVSVVYVRDAFWGRKKEYKIPAEIFLRIWKKPEAGKKISLEEKEECSNYMIATLGTPADTAEGGITPPPPAGNTGANDSSSVEVGNQPAPNHDTAETETPTSHIQAQLEILKAINDIMKKLLELQAAILSAITGSNNGTNNDGQPADSKPAGHKPDRVNTGTGEETVLTAGADGVAHNAPPAWAQDKKKNGTQKSAAELKSMFDRK